MSSEKVRRDIQIDNLALLAWITLIFIATSVWTKFAFLFYWCPLLMSFPSIFFTAIPEHYGCEKTSNPLNNTRTTLSNSFVRDAYPSSTSIGTKFMVQRQLRGSRIALGMMQAHYNQLLLDRIKFDFIDCDLHMISFFLSEARLPIH